MAKIMGCQLKGVKTFNGMEGLAFQGTLYIDNKKVGICGDSGNGGCLDIWMDDKNSDAVLDDKRKAYYEKYPDKDFEKMMLNGKYKKTAEDVYDNDMFINEIFNLWDIERYYKKMAKKGYSILVYEKYSAFHDGPTPCNEMVVFGGEKAPIAAQDHMTKKRKEFPFVEFQVFTRPEDFNID